MTPTRSHPRPNDTTGPADAAPARGCPHESRRRSRAWSALACTLVLGAGTGRAQTLRTDFWITNGQVNAQALRGNTLYVGGTFSFVGPITGAGVPVDAVTGVPQSGFPAVNGSVFSAVPDGSGGWFIGGQFTSVGTSVRANLAHVLSDRSVSAWNPGTDGAVRALVLHAGVLYAGGDFLTLGGVARNRIGAVDASTGTTSAWNPNANGSVRSFADGGGSLYVGGLFITIGGHSRNRLASLSYSTGNADPTWNPNANSTVLALWLDPVASVLYVGGQFTSVDGQTRNRIAALDAASGSVTGWNPATNGTVNSLVAGGGAVYAGGLFTLIGGQLRNRIAALDPSTGQATSWNADAGNTVQTLALGGSTLFAGGDFLTIGGQSRSRVAELSTATGAATAWNPSAFGTVSVLTPDGGQVFVGGSFNGVGGTARNNLAAFDVTTGQATAWDPNANNQVQALLATPTALYVGGNFTGVGGQIRNNVAALDLTNGLATAWDPNADGQVSALALQGTRVYLGGLFNHVGGQPHVNLAAVDASSGLPLSWTADTDDQVFALDASATRLYVGGNFTLLGGLTRNFVGAVDPATAAVAAWDPNANGTVRTLVSTCDRVYLGGFFTTIGGQARNRLAALNLTNGQALAWDPNTNGLVFSVVAAPGVVYVGGVLSTIGAQARNRVAAVDPATGVVTPWNPNSGGTVRALAADANDVYIGGAFASMGGLSSGNLAAVSPDASAPCPAIALTAPPLAPGVAGTAYSAAIVASGGAGPYCYAVSAGSLPAGLALDPATGQLSGTPAGPGVSVFTVSATDTRRCVGTSSYTLSVTAAPAVNSVAANGAGLCLNPLQTCVSLPFVLTRGDATGLRAVSVTLQLETAKLRPCTNGTLSSNVHLGTWANTFTNRSVQVSDLGSGRYEVDVVLLGQPCGATGGGSLFTFDLAAQGPLGTGSVTVTSVTARDCANAAVGVSAGPAGSVSISSSSIVLAPSTLPDATTGSAYSQTLTASGGTPPYTFSVSAGTLPPGLALSSAGALTGTPSQGGTFAFTVTAAEAGGCAGSRAYSLTAICPALSVNPVFLPDGSVGTTYSATLTAPAGFPPLAFAVTAGALPAGVTLDPSGQLGGTPTTAGPSSFTIGVTDAAGCTGSRAYTVDIFASPPVSSVAAQAAGLAISTAHPCVSVPVVYTRGESQPARGLTVSFQLDPTKLQLCSSPATAVHLGTWFNGFGNTSLNVTTDGTGAYTVDVALVGTPCGITTGGTLFTVDLQAAGADGQGSIAVTRVKSRDCDGNSIAVQAGATASLRIQNTPITLAPPTLPNGLVGQAYSQAITAQSGVAPFTFSVSAGTPPAGLTLSAAGVLAGTPSTVGSSSFTVSVADVDGVPGSRAYTMSIACPVIAILPSTLPDAQLGTAYAQTLTASGGTAPHSFAVTSGSLPAGLSLAPTGELTGTPTAAGSTVFTVTALDNFDCVGSEVYTLAVFVDPAISRVFASTAGLCLSASRTCVSVPFIYQRGDSASAMAAHVSFHLDSRFALCTPATPASSIHQGSWLAAFANKTFQVTDDGGGSFTVDQSLLGQPCGTTHGGVLFTVDVASAGADGAGDVTVTDSRIRNCANQPLPGSPGAPAQLIVSHTPPPAITDLASAQVLAGNAPGSRTGITLTWTTPAPGPIALYRAPFGTYPEFDDGGGTLPDSAAAPGAPWTLVSAAAITGLVDHPSTRGSWHYVAFLTDSCGNRSAVSNLTRGSLDYHLGDVSDGVTRGTGNNRVGTEDISLLGAHYGISGATLVSDSVAYLDVGPTIDGLPTSRPATDDIIDFEDLIVFSLNYHTVSGPQAGARPAPPPGTTAKSESFELDAPALVAPGDEVVAGLHLAAAGAMQGFSAQLAWNALVVQPVAVESGGFLESQGGVMLSPRPGGADAALLGVRGTGISGSGDVARFRFKVLREGDAGLRIARVIARDAANRPLEPGGLSRSVVAAIPARTLLLAPSPNPARDAATLAFALARRSDAELAIFSVDGRRVRTLARGTRDAGAYHITWKGDDDGGRDQAPGVYWARLQAAGQTYTRRIVFLR